MDDNKDNVDGTAPAGAANTNGDATTAEKSTGVVALDADQHEEAKSVFQLLRDKVLQGEQEVEEEFAKLKALLHL